MPVSVGVPSLWVMTTNECSAGAEVVASVALNQQRKLPRLNGVYAEAWMSVPSVSILRVNSLAHQPRLLRHGLQYFRYVRDLLIYRCNGKKERNYFGSSPNSVGIPP